MIPNDARAIETCHTWTDDVARLVTESDGIREALLENHGLVMVPAARVAALKHALLAALNVLDDWGFMEEAQLCHDALHKLRPISTEATGG